MKTVAKPQKKNRFSILQTVFEARNVKGVKRGEFHDYAKFNTRAVEQQRKKSLLTQTNKKKFLKKDVEAPRSTEELVLLIRQTERYWSKAMGLEEKSCYSSRYRLSMVKKFKKASKSASHLAKMTKKAVYSIKKRSVKPINELEAFAYAGYMRSTYTSESFPLEAALKTLSQTRTVVSHLILIAKRHHSSKIAAFAYSLLELVDARLCYLAYQMDLAEQKDAEAIASSALERCSDEELEPMAKLLRGFNISVEHLRQPAAGGTSAESQLTVAFRGRTVAAHPPQLNKILKQYLLSDMDLQELLVDAGSTASEVETAFGYVHNLLGRLQTIARASKNSTAKLAVTTDSARIKASLKDAEWLYTYFKVTQSSAKLSHWFYKYRMSPRNSDRKKRIRLLSSMGVECERLAAVDLLKDDFVFSNLLHAKHDLIRALRALELARAHFGANQLREGSLLFHKVAQQKYVEPARERLAGLHRKRDLFELEQDQSDLDNLEHRWATLVMSVSEETLSLESRLWTEALSHTRPMDTGKSKKRSKHAKLTCESLEQLEEADWIRRDKGRPFSLKDVDGIFKLEDYNFTSKPSEVAKSPSESSAEAKKGWFKGWF